MPKSFEVRKSEPMIGSRTYVARQYFAASALPSLSAYFGNVVKGNDVIYDSPFAKGESTEHMLQEWMSHLVSIKTRWPSLWEYENEQSHKVGPLSVMKPLRERMDDIEAYYKGILLPSEPIDGKAIRAVLSEWTPHGRMIPRSPARTVDNMRLSTNSGCPYFTKRRHVITSIERSLVETSNDDVTISCNSAGGGHTEEFLGCAVLGWRGQEAGLDADDVKQRVVWMFPAAVNRAELQVYQPLIAQAQRYSIIPAWVGMDAVDARVTKLFDTKESRDLIVCTDFSKFDQHFNQDLQNCARAILRGLFTGSAFEDWLLEVFDAKYMIPLMYDFGAIKKGRHGMGSGSGGTNADETLSHRALQYEAAQIKKYVLNPNSQCLGDDGMLSYPGIRVEDVVEAYSRHGLEMNPDKQYASTHDCIYLRRWHDQKYRVEGVCVGVYPTMRALGRMRYLERYMNPKYWDETTVNLRYLSILENVKYHPLREEFVQFCMKRDKYRLGLDIPGFFDNIARIAQKAIDNMPDLIGYVQSMQGGVSGIDKWWIVNYLKSLR